MTDDGEFILRSEGASGAELERLVRRYVPWVADRVRRRLGPALRAKAETQDFIEQVEAVVKRHPEAAEYQPEPMF